MLYNITLLSDPIDNNIHVEIPMKGNHDTLILIVRHTPDIGNRVQLIECKKSTTAVRIPKWRSMLRYAFITSIQGHNINTI